MAEKKVYYATGRRKTSVARVYMTKGKGVFTVNKKPMDEYFGRETSSMIVNQPLDVVEMHNKFDFNIIDLSNFKDNFDLRAFNLFLLSSCKHFIVTPSTFNWWGAWLSININKIIIRPDDFNFSLFQVNNIDFWPSNWIKI